MNREKTYLFVFIVCLTVFAAGFRIYGLTFQSMWLDELLSLAHSVPSEGIEEPIHFAITRDGSPPLFNVLLWFWRLAFGNSEYAVRMLPALFGVLGVLCMFFLGKEMFSTRVGVYASLLTAVLPFHIAYSQEVRPYSLLFLLCALSYFFFIKFVKRKCFKWGLLYVMVTLCMLYTHYFGFLIIFAQFIHLCVIFLSSRDLDRWNFLKSYLPIVILLALAYLPWIGRIRRLSRVKKIWIETPSFDFFVSYFKGYFGDALYVVLICLVLMGVYLLHKSYMDELPYHRVLLFSSVIVVFFVPYLRSLKHPSILTPRNTIVALPAIVLMASVGLHRFKRVGVRILVFGSLMLMLLGNIFLTSGNYYRTVTKEQWREAAKHVLDEDPEGRYPVFVDGRIRYYFYDVFKSKRKLWPRIQTSANAKRASEFISERKTPGFWVVEAHQHMDKEAQQFLDSMYSVKDRKLLKGARVTFYALEEPQD